MIGRHRASAAPVNPTSIGLRNRLARLRRAAFPLASAVPPYSMDVAALNCVIGDGNRDLSIATQEYSHAFR